MRMLIGLVLLLCSFQAPADVILRHATILDGRGTRASTGAIAVRNGRIIAVGRFEGAAAQTIDCTGLVVAPGFVDLHNHSDRTVTRRSNRPCTNYLTQGCTTLVTGNCGSGRLDVAEFLKSCDEGLGCNIIHLIPHGTLRQEVLGKANRAPSADELRTMQIRAARGMRDGAWGLATGLYYVPGVFAKTPELVALSRTVVSHGGIYASHMRHEDERILDSIDEIIAIAEGAGIAVHVSHFKARGRRAWGKTAEAIRRIEAARARGLRVTADQYPYVASSSSLEAYLIPAWAREGGRRQLRERLDDPDTLARIKAGIRDRLETYPDIRIAQARNRAWLGKSLAEIAASAKTSVVDVVLSIERKGGAAVVNFAMDEAEVQRVMQQPWVATASDGYVMTRSPTKPHPRSFGTFPRKLGRYARDVKAVSLANAVRSMTGLPADILGLDDRGYLEPGYVADIVVFDPTTVEDRATFDRPFEVAAGIVHVLVAGKAAIRDGKPTGVRAGRALRPPAARTVPGKAWELHADIAKAGWDSAKLDAAHAYMKTIDSAAVLLVTGGKVVADWGETSKRFWCHSMRKSLLSALYGVHVHAGRIDREATLALLGIDDPQRLDDREKSATVQQLLEARSGVYIKAAAETSSMAKRRPKRHSHAPGTFWYYNNWDFNVLGTIFRKRAKTEIGADFALRIARPLGMQDFRPGDVRHAKPGRWAHPAYRFTMSARDLARFGLLMLRRGRWGSHRVLPAAWVDESTRDHSRIGPGRGYGYMWWTRELPDHGRLVYAAGYRGHYVVVVPKYDTVLVHRVDTYTRDDRVTAAEFDKLLAAILAARQ